MTKSVIDRWIGFSLRTERDLSACRSWFGGLVGDADRLLLAEGYETDEGEMPRLRVVFQRPDGAVRMAVRSNGKRTWTVKVTSAPTAVLKRLPSGPQDQKYARS